LTQDLIIKVYGGANVCVSFDYFPMNMFGGVAWIFVCGLFCFHSVTFCMRLKAYFPDHSRLRGIAPYVALIFNMGNALLIISFIVPPWESVFVHTIGYQCFIVGIMIWFLFNLVVVENWPETFPKGALRFFRACMVVFALLSVLKIYLQYVLLGIYYGKIGPDDFPLVPMFARTFPDWIWMLTITLFRWLHPLSRKLVSVSVAVSSKSHRGAHLFGRDYAVDRSSPSKSSFHCPC